MLEEAHKMAEEAHKFGRHQHLAGVVARPANSRPSHQYPAIIIVNAGFIHHVGPWLLHVHLARQIAALGLYALRFDLSGLGDSALPPERQSVTDRKNADISDAIQFMRLQFGVKNVVMVGLCSGAVDSHRAALIDERIRGVVMLDPPAYPDARYYLLYYVEKLCNPARLFRVCARISRQYFAKQQVEINLVPRIHRPIPAHEFALQVEAVTAKGTLYMFSYSAEREYRHTGQLFSILTKATPRENISVFRFPRFDHTQMKRADRQVIIQTICTWIQDQFLGCRDQEGPILESA